MTEKTMARGRSCQEKWNIAVLFGGRSPEYEVSLQSAHAVIQHMDKDRFTPIPIGITRRGEWYRFNGDIDEIAADTWHTSGECTPFNFPLGRTSHALLDAVFPVLHGKNGEDGTVQGLFELLGVPVVGCGVLASALCMDKNRAHRLAQAAGVAVPCSHTFTRVADPEMIRVHAEAIGLPVFVKPVRAGSSFGITKVTEFRDLPAALELAFRYDDEVLIEETIPGFEVGCAVMGNETLTVGEVDEIELADGFFDYTEKYTLKTSAIHVPARVDASAAQRIKETARTIYRALGCQGFARVDMFLTPAGEIVFNEVNTIPGFTAHSRFPSMMKAAGIPFEQVITTVIELAVGK